MDGMDEVRTESPDGCEAGGKGGWLYVWPWSKKESVQSPSPAVAESSIAMEGKKGSL